MKHDRDLKTSAEGAPHESDGGGPQVHGSCHTRHAEKATGAVPAPEAGAPGVPAPGAPHPHYTSTYCIHGQHDQCRLTCKLCAAPCRCACHGSHGD